MHFLVIGATGRTGQLVVDEALSRGHTVTALARKPESLSARANLTVTKGSPEKIEDIVAAINNTFNEPTQAIVVTLAAPRESDSPFAKPIGDPWFMTKAAQNTRTAIKSAGLEKTAKIVLMSAWGVADSYASLNILMKGMISHSPMKVQFRDHDKVDEETKKSGLNFVMVRPVMLKGEEKAEVKELGDQGKAAGFMPSISRASVAKFLVDAADSRKWDGRTPVISN
jgi:uncharacterized protein YbjT (DUF2867 family)